MLADRRQSTVVISWVVTRALATSLLKSWTQAESDSSSPSSCRRVSEA